ncbi:uncharacterized protein ACHE_80277S [Aspergillus chevalieri]|uniref:Uncharacterized protein n=1 Tax=Aspergillus chevalieri TaxID=182096 RepID=A0A7R7VX32_ASPCH|nr:uncharacterized protein ACHE_80277S [Aspergillus chevalieri]BCR92377.1 hypothetical protein ACHE_80277S [Aspergillus chevalieri]
MAPGPSGRPSRSNQAEHHGLVEPQVLVLVQWYAAASAMTLKPPHPYQGWRRGKHLSSILVQPEPHPSRE